MTWIEDELEFRDELRAGAAPAPTEQESAAAVREWWRWLGGSLKRNVEVAQERATVMADVSAPFTDTYRVNHPDAGLAMTVVLDEQMRTATFDYTSSEQRAIAPQGGVLTLRPRAGGRIAVYYADQH